MKGITGLRLAKELCLAWTAGVVCGLLVGVADLIYITVTGDTSLVSAVFLAFRTAGQILLISGIFILVVYGILRILRMIKPGSLSTEAEYGIILGSGVIPILTVLLYNRYGNIYQPLVMAQVVAGIVVLVIAAAFRWIIRSRSFIERFVAAGPTIALLGTLIIVILYGIPLLVSGFDPPDAIKVKQMKGAEAPNIMLIVLDSARADRFSVYGYKRKTTPFIEEIAKDATVFDGAISVSPWTLPSHASLFTGLYPGQHNTHAEHFWLDDSYQTLAEILLGRGYQTVVISNNDYVSDSTNLIQGFERCWLKGKWTDDLRYSVRSLGLFTDFFLESQWNEIETKYLATIVKNPADFYEYPNASITNRAIADWLDNGRDPNRPFFMFINLMDVHFPYNPNDETARLFLKEDALENSHDLKLRVPPVEYCLDLAKGKYTQEELHIINSLYDADIRYVDGEVKNLVDKLKSTDLFDKTAFILTSDHGEYLGTHNRLAHGLGLHEELLHIPLIARYPGVFAAGERSDKLVTQADIFQTVLALADVKESPTRLPGAQILYDRQQEGRPYVFAEYRFPLHVMVGASLREDNAELFMEQKAIRSQTHKLVWKSRGAPVYYNLIQDPMEKAGISFVEGDLMIQRMMYELEGWMRTSIPSGMESGSAVGISKEENQKLLKKLRALGYVK